MFDTPYHIVPVKKKTERGTDESYDINRSGEKNPICRTDDYQFARQIVEALNEKEAAKKAKRAA
jgi:hypothetical protein